MKIDINLSGFNEDENGVQIEPDLVDVIAQKIAGHMSERVRVEISDKIKNQIFDLITKEVEKKSAEVLNDFLDFEFEEVTSWGEKRGKWTVRNKMAQALKDAVQFEKKDFWNSSQQTPFTKLLVSAIENEIKPFRNQMIEMMNSEFKKQCVEAAANQIKDRLGIKIKD